jgi:uncharacterized protein YecE (DUF72 family)
MMARCRIGTSGWVYRHWRGPFYPSDLPQKRWFEFYAQHFDTVEINNTFYRLPSEAAFDGWREQAPPGFVYALKASRFLTHVKRLKEPATPLENFLSRARRLGDHLGPILYQLPPNWHANLERLDKFLALLPHDLIHVLEFRDPSWLIEPVFELLTRHGVGFCIMSLPGVECPVRATAPTVYIRLHGAEQTYASRYSLDQLREWAEIIRGFLAEGRQVFVYFNNDAWGYAVENARELRDRLPHDKC